MPRPVEPADEQRHQDDGSADWTESWHFAFHDSTASFAGYARITLVPNQSRCWYWSALYRPDELLLSVIDNEVEFPRVPGSLEARGDGLWMDHICETPLDHWSVGNEAFALGVDDARDMVGSMRGELVPYGLDLEWETTTEVQRETQHPDGSPIESDLLEGYVMGARVSGEALVGDGCYTDDLVGFRHHRWGRRPTQPHVHLRSASVAATLPATDIPADWVEQYPIGESVKLRSYEFTPAAWLPAVAAWSTGDEVVPLSFGRLADGEPAWLELVDQPRS